MSVNGVLGGSTLSAAYLPLLERGGRQVSSETSSPPAQASVAPKPSSGPVASPASASAALLAGAALLPTAASPLLSKYAGDVEVGASETLSEGITLSVFKFVDPSQLEDSGPPTGAAATPGSNAASPTSPAAGGDGNASADAIYQGVVNDLNAFANAFEAGQKGAAGGNTDPASSQAQQTPTSGAVPATSTGTSPQTAAYAKAATSTQSASRATTTA